MENKEAIDFLIGQGYAKTVTYPDKTTVEPTFQWTTVIRLLESYFASQNEELIKENEELKKENCHFSAEITYLYDKYAISDYTKIIQDRNKEISDLKYKLAKIKELKDQASDVKELFPLLQYISKLEL